MKIQQKLLLHENTTKKLTFCCKRGIQLYVESPNFVRREQAQLYQLFSLSQQTVRKDYRVTMNTLIVIMGMMDLQDRGLILLVVMIEKLSTFTHLTKWGQTTTAAGTSLTPWRYLCEQAQLYQLCQKRLWQLRGSWLY
jgi:hypothetical protein